MSAVVYGVENHPREAMSRQRHRCRKGNSKRRSKQDKWGTLYKGNGTGMVKEGRELMDRERERNIDWRSGFPLPHTMFSHLYHHKVSAN